jgi:hypothetical protein
VHTNINASTSMVAVDAVASWAQLVTACAAFQMSANITLIEPRLSDGSVHQSD